MEMDYNLKKLANFFKLFLCILEKLLITNYSLFSPVGVQSLYYFIRKSRSEIFKWVRFKQAKYERFGAVLCRLQKSYIKYNLGNFKQSMKQWLIIKYTT